MAELVTTGTWMVIPTKEVAFVEAWTSFAEWASTMSGAGTLRLGRDVGDSQRFVSYADWEDVDSVRAWKSTLEFRERMAHVLQHVDDFHPTELSVVATGVDGKGALTVPVHGGVK
jgi:heme-degrading monooxygenase HmoA